MPTLDHSNDPSLNFAPFDGDGRERVEPIAPRPGTRPRGVSHNTARSVIKEFIEQGGSTHSEAGSVLWVIEAWCKKQGIAVTVIQHEAGGYVTTKGPT
ncbi:hypothetical protein SAMN05444679_12617 [Variovorax sp. CF079]|uniref:hypothetical protein n=1 Tax=Variovorax sp. CF079 TaxID=1882774 RepID=UPI00088BCCB7|nr:hypothetical protein [Variovorax sp. CF079]SDE60997.1 hypothetical protein SAMN05444679_12617 [Variovorax sp. CF079]